MYPKSPFFLFLFLCFSLNSFLNAQTQHDSLAKYSYEELYILMDDLGDSNPKLSKIYAKEYLRRAKLENDNIKISRGYFYLTLYYSELDSKKAMRYTDSIIDVCKDCQHKTYPAMGYHFKGYLLYNARDYKKSLNNFLIAYELSEKNKNISLGIDIRNSILSIKSNLDANFDILNYRKESLDFIKKQKLYKINHRIDYIITLNNLALECLRNEKYASGLKLAKEGINETINTKDKIDYYEFVSIGGDAQYYLGNYKAAIDSCLKVLPYVKGIKISIKNYYLAKSYDKLNQPEKAHDYFLKVDFMYVKTQDLFPELRNTYEHIVEYYKEKGDTEQQLFYLERLIETDAKIDSVYKYVNETINKKFDTPQAIAERNRLVEEAKAKENSWKYSFSVIATVLLAVLGFLVIMLRRQKYYKQRFENLMNTSASLNVQKTNSEVTETSIERSRNALNVTSEKENTPTREIDVPKEIIDTILNQLQKFEASQKFTKQITLAELSKNLKTNQKYLSKVINWHYEKNFSTYINELRIEYVISKLKEDSKFRNYTIKAISKEAGFGNTESFSKAFYKATGIKPSYFIKELHKRLES